MYVDTNTIIKFATVIGALGTILIMLYKGFQFLERQREQDKEIKSIKEEQCVMCYAILAVLDGLKQVGANGDVTKAYNKLEKHLNQSAHDWGK